MGRTKKLEGNLAAIAEERERLQAMLKELDDAEQRALELTRDAGREMFLTALEEVQIPSMGRRQAKAIAKAIEKFGPDEVLRRLKS